jgi:phosphate transport system substrate-binding protein
MVNIPLAVSAQQVNYNVPGLRPATHLKLNGKVLAEMYQGSVTSWNDPRIAALNPGVALPHTRVVPLHRADSSGDTFLFTSYLSTQDAAWDRVTGYGTTVAWPHVPGARAEIHNSGMVAGCESTPGCVAYIGIAYLTPATNGGLGYAALRNALGDYEAPTPKSIGTAVGSFVSTTPVNETISMVDGPAVTGYPIVNYEYAIVSTRQRSPAKARDIKAFLHWVITAGNAPRYLGQFRFQPLPASIVSLSDAQIAKIG